MKIERKNLFYRYMPSFGIDIGHSSVKVMQLKKLKNRFLMQAYGTAQLNHNSTDKGVITDPETVSRKIYELITSSVKGKITYSRASFSIPNEYCFSRVITVPKLNEKDLLEAINNELSQSMPLPIDDIYYDYDLVDLNEQFEIQLVATPKVIVDSYLKVSETLGIDTAFIQTNIGAVTSTVVNSEITNNRVSLIIDFGSSAADLTLYDGNEIRITSTANCGGETVTRAIANKLGINTVQAHILKTRYGLDPSKKQKQIIQAVNPVYDNLFVEISKVSKYLVEHTNGKAIEQIIIVGGGSNIPGISNYMTDNLKIPTRVCNPWKNIDFNQIDKPDSLDSTLYTTVIGLAMGQEEDFIK